MEVCYYIEVRIRARVRVLSKYLNEDFPDYIEYLFN